MTSIVLCVLFHVSLVSWASSRDFYFIIKQDQIFVVFRLCGKVIREKVCRHRRLEKLFINLNYPNYLYNNVLVYYVYQFTCLSLVSWAQLIYFCSAEKEIGLHVRICILETYQDKMILEPSPNKTNLNMKSNFFDGKAIMVHLL